MLSFRYPFMYAQEATGMCQLLETTGDLELLITIVLPGDMSRLGPDIGKKTWIYNDLQGLSSPTYMEDALNLDVTLCYLGLQIRW